MPIVNATHPHTIKVHNGEGLETEAKLSVSVQFNSSCISDIVQLPQTLTLTYRVSDVEKGVVILKKKVPGMPFLRLAVSALVDAVY